MASGTCLFFPVWSKYVARLVGVNNERCVDGWCQILNTAIMNCTSLFFYIYCGKNSCIYFTLTE